MLKIIEKNKLYFALYFVFFALSFLLTANGEKLDATFYFSNHRSVFGDVFFKFWTYLGEAYPFVFIAVFSIIQKNQRLAWKIAATGTFALLIVGLLKSYFGVPRPAILLDNLHLSAAINFVEGVDLLRGNNSFPSGHTAAAFALWSLLAFQFPKYPRLQILCFLTAFFVGLSRIYLVQHFAADTLLGSAIGICTALLIEFVFEKYWLVKPVKTAKVIQISPQNTPSV